MSRTVLPFLLLLVMVMGAVTAATQIPMDNALAPEGHTRHLLAPPENEAQYFDSKTGAVYTAYGWWDDENDYQSPEHWPANAVEAFINCTRMGQEQPDCNNPADFFAMKYLSAGHKMYMKTREGDEDYCTYISGVYCYTGKNNYDSSTCGERYWYACVQRKAEKCGKGPQYCPKGTCCGSMCCGCGAKCCHRQVCCPTGTKCCRKGRYAYCQNILVRRC